MAWVRPSIEGIGIAIGTLVGACHQLIDGAILDIAIDVVVWYILRRDSKYPWPWKLIGEHPGEIVELLPCLADQPVKIHQTPIVYCHEAMESITAPLRRVPFDHMEPNPKHRLEAVLLCLQRQRDMSIGVVFISYANSPVPDIVMNIPHGQEALAE